MEILTGLRPGAVVVTDGNGALRDGAAIDAATASTPAPRSAAVPEPASAPVPAPGSAPASTAPGNAPAR
jgi:hypothetical protein